jgi:predicted S18 family serine protease
MIVANAGSETINGTGIDRRGKNSCVVFAKAGTATGSPSSFTFDVEIEHSTAQGSGFADPSTSHDLTQITANGGSAYLDIDLSGYNRYVRVNATVALTGGSSPKLPIAVGIILGGSDTLPVA